MGISYDFSNIDEWFNYGLKTGYADGFMFIGTNYTFSHFKHPFYRGEK